MSNQVFNIMAASYFDQLSGGCWGYLIGGCDTSILHGSLNNPLQAYRLLCVDVQSGTNFDAEELASITGVPAAWFHEDKLDASPDEALKALGVMALVYLSCLRNEAMKSGFEVESAENALEAKNTLIEVLKTNKRLWI